MSVEAVNSVLQAAPVIRASAEQVSTADSSGNPARVQKVAQAPYVSPYFTVDVTTDTVVTQIRDSSTGKVLQQIPSQTSLDTRTTQTADQPAPVRPQTAEAPQQQTQQQSSPAPVSTPAPAPQQQSTASAATAQQIAAFAAASQSGNTNAGNVSLFA